MEIEAQNRNRSPRPLPRPAVYKVKYDRVNGSIFNGLKYAQIYFANRAPYEEPVKTLYGITWNHLGSRVDKWLDQHEFDVPIDWYA